MTNNGKQSCFQNSTKNAMVTEQLDNVKAELESFYDYCKENGLKNEEINEICKPLAVAVRKHKKSHLAKITIIAVTIIFFGYTLSHSEFVMWNLTAIGRFVMIKLIPIWDWRPLRKEKCLFGFSDNEVINGPNFDCVLCESLNSIAVEKEVHSDFLNEQYINLHNPVLIMNTLTKWPSIAKDFNITDVILSDSVLSDSYPCLQSSNILSSSTTIAQILLKIQTFQRPYFVHFLNCDFLAMKHFRTFAPRPDFLPVEISPIQYSWLLMSNNYEMGKFKMIELRERIMIFAQISGSNFIKLMPKDPCEMDCPVLQTEISTGEVLLFTNLWILKYRPNPTTKNVAVILELN